IGGTIVGAARASVPAASLTRRLWQITAIIWGTGFAALLLILGGAAFMARRVTGPLAEMQAAAKEMGAGNLARRVQVGTGDELEEMANAMNRMASHLADTIAQLDAGKTRLETLLANLDDGVIVIAADRSVRMMNREAGKIFDASETMGAGRPYPEVIRHPRALAFIDGWVKGEEPKPQETEIAPVTEVQTWTKFEGTTNVMLNHRLELPADKAKPGMSVKVRAVAYDKRDYHKFGMDLNPQQAASGWHTVRIIDPEAKAADGLKDAENLRGAIFKILEKQIRTRI
ncbi:MAG TPA: HAMP domain-containing protein, partial [Thermodesulfobacteriota bacterium]|nr:HAMP domain-containing protein [Thermodesulfobacteriota bacterium]